MKYNKFKYIIIIFTFFVFISCNVHAQINCFKDYNDTQPAIYPRQVLLKCVLDMDYFNKSASWFLEDELIKTEKIMNPYAVQLLYFFNETNKTYIKGEEINFYLKVNGKQEKIKVKFIEDNIENQVMLSEEDALWFLHSTQKRYSFGDEEYGFWMNDYLRRWSVAYTAMTIVAFQSAGYYQYSDHPYADNIKRGFNHILSYCNYELIGQQYKGNPDLNGNLIGLKCSNYRQHTNYEVSVSLLAFAMSDSFDVVSKVGGPFVRGRTYGNITQDLIEWLLWAQNDNIAAKGGQGAWYYTENNPQGDMSVTQYPALAITLVSHFLDIEIPKWTHEEILFWVDKVQTEEGGFAYTATNPTGTIAMTASGLIASAYGNLSQTDYRVEKGIDYLAKRWYTNISEDRQDHFGSFYSMYGVNNVCNIFDMTEEGINCTQDYQQFLLSKQNPKGYWQDASYLKIHVDPILATAWGVMILTEPTVFSVIYKDFK
jgi:hypothetical protein